MELNSQQVLRLRALTSRLCDGELVGEEFVELATLLDGNPAAMAEYLAYTSLHLDLGQRLQPCLDATVPSQKFTRQVTSNSGPLGGATPHTRPPNRRFHWTALAAIAASLLVAAAYLMHSTNSRPSYTARIVNMFDCDWRQELSGSSKPTLLRAGQQIHFTRGLMVIGFASGAEVILEAPVSFSIIDSNRGQLNTGKLTATVPAPAHGFVVKLPAFEVIDLGTRFGARVSESGDCEAHVFEGHVRVRTLARDQQSQEVDLSAGAAVQLANDDGHLHEITAVPELFEKEPRVLSRLLPNDE